MLKRIQFLTLLLLVVSLGFGCAKKEAMDQAFDDAPADEMVFEDSDPMDEPVYDDEDPMMDDAVDDEPMDDDSLNDEEMDDTSDE